MKKSHKTKNPFSFENGFLFVSRVRKRTVRNPRNFKIHCCGGGIILNPIKYSNQKVVNKSIGIQKTTANILKNTVALLWMFLI